MTYTVRSFERPVCCNAYKELKSAAIYRTAVFKQTDMAHEVPLVLTSCPLHHYANSCQKNWPLLYTYKWSQL